MEICTTKMEFLRKSMKPSSLSYIIEKRNNVCSIRAYGESSGATRFPVIIEQNEHVVPLWKSQGAAISVDVQMHEHTPSQLLYSPSSANRAP